MAAGDPHIQSMNYVTVGSTMTRLDGAFGKCVLKRMRRKANYEPLNGAQRTAVSENEMWTVDLDILIDPAVNDIFEGALGGVLAIQMRASDEAEAATNRTYSGNIAIHEYAPHGDASSGEMRTLAVTYDGDDDLTVSPAI